MRGTATVATPFPFAATLPGLMQDDDLVRRLCAALDEVLAPVVVTLDCLPAYLDPGTAPVDVRDWLAGWVGLELPDGTPDDLRRRLIGRAADLHRWRGTPRGVREAVAAWTGVEPELSESGGATWSTESGAPLPGYADPTLHVRLRVPDPDRIDLVRLEAVAAAAAPAHVRTSVEVLAG
jgi:phage tail-like protein